MSILIRLKGAILVETNNEYYLVGQLKEPCNFMDFGFEDPGELQAPATPYVRLKHSDVPKLNDLTDRLSFYSEYEEDIFQKVADVFMIERNGSISERLWGLVMEFSSVQNGVKDGNWLASTPVEVWEIVRDSMLKC